MGEPGVGALNAAMGLAGSSGRAGASPSPVANAWSPAFGSRWPAGAPRSP